MKFITASIYHILIFLMVVSLGCTTGIRKNSIRQTAPDKLPSLALEKEKIPDNPGPPPFKEKLLPVSKDLRHNPRLFSLVFDSAPFGDVLKAITDDATLNISIESEVNMNKVITVHLKQATFREAIDMVVEKGAGYAWHIEEGTLYIKAFQEKIYHLDYLDMVGSTDIEVGGDMLASGVENSGVTGKFQVKAKREGKSSDIWEGIQNILEGLKSENGTLQINRNTGIIYMKDMPAKIESMVTFLDTLTETLHRQVFIEAKILEIQLKDTNRYGIDWTSMQIRGTANDEFFVDNLDIGFNSGGSFFLSDQSAIGMIVDFLKTQGDITVLSNPHITVMNGQSALMTVGSQFPFGDITGVDRDIETGTTTYGVSIKRAVLGLQLGITPQIAKNGIVTLHIVPTITRIQGLEQVDIPTSATSSQAISNPIIDLQELATTVRVMEGKSIVLAGLISQIKQIDQKGLPILGEIPLLKYLFSHEEESNSNKELVIFITPYIKDAM